MSGVVEIMGYCTGTYEATTNEFIYNVDGRQFHLYFSHNDGWNDVHTANSGTCVYTAKLVLSFCVISASYSWWVLLKLCTYKSVCVRMHLSPNHYLS